MSRLRHRPRRPARAAITLLIVLAATGAARAGDDQRAAPPVTPLGRARPPTRETPLFFRDLELRAPKLEVPSSRHLRRALAVGRPPELALRDYVRLAVHGDGQAGLSTFVGASTESLCGFRLRF